MSLMIKLMSSACRRDMSSEIVRRSSHTARGNPARSKTTANASSGVQSLPRGLASFARVPELTATLAIPLLMEVDAFLLEASGSCEPACSPGFVLVRAC